ncbi:hypothetical protein [Acinetobacter terrae]|uniref:Uncharacterized protein n=1 Tax=Acinetobacter terrae TaxID=2731247 RepID=A0A8E4FCC3_9GAMM|nr:hypothetical protein [Acinetobacter terrae]NNH38934.1 hypothetical protein [Acinetobacter terrae]
MEYILMGFSFLFSFYSLFKLNKKYYYYTPLFLISIYSLFISFASLGIVTSDFADMWSSGGVLKNSSAVSLYTIFIIFSFFTPIFCIEKIYGKYKFELLKSFNLKSFNEKNILISAFIVLILTSINFFSLNKGILWENNKYLLIGSVDALKNVNFFTVVVQMLSPLVGVFAVLILATSYSLNFKKAFVLIFFPALFFIFLKIGDHSRYSAMYILIILISILFLSKRSIDKWVTIPVFFLVFLGNLINSLEGRSNVTHGFKSIVNYFDNIFKFLSDGKIFSIFSNIFEGAFVHGEAFNYTYHNYPLIFKILSLSPLPSFIDGYSNKGHQYSFFLHNYVPMGATGELLIFGLPYIIFYFSIISIALILNYIALKNRKNLIFIISIFLICLGAYLQFTYPIRNCFRFFYISIFLCLFFIYMPRFRWGR